MIFNRLWALVTLTATTSELWLLHSQPKIFSIPLEVYTSYQHIISHHPTKFREIPTKIVLSSTPFLSQSLSTALAIYPYTDLLIAQPSLIGVAWFVYHSTQKIAFFPLIPRPLRSDYPLRKTSSFWVTPISVSPWNTPIFSISYLHRFSLDFFYYILIRLVHYSSSQSCYPHSSTIARFATTMSESTSHPRFKSLSFSNYSV